LGRRPALAAGAALHHHRAMSVSVAYANAFAVAVFCQIAFFVPFLLHRRPAGSEKTTRVAPVSILGIAVQGLGYAAIWLLERRRFTPIVPLPGPLAYLPPLISVALAVASLWMATASLRTLGKEWSLEARVIEDHRLVTAGPYRLVRHPIYSAMLGILIATGIGVSHWIGLLAGVVILSLGTWIRVRSEERLLRTEFGAAYDDYARRVPALVPRLFPRPSKLP
jgi:protein-S-isoprenylcysteine O-methyltransferase Ste14